MLRYPAQGELRALLDPRFCELSPYIAAELSGGEKGGPARDVPRALAYLVAETACADALAWHFSPQRKVPTATIFYQGTPILVEKRALDGQGERLLECEGFQVRWCPLAKSPLQSGTPLVQILLERWQHGWAPARALLKEHSAWALKEFASSPGLLRGESLDATFRNTVWDGSRYAAFDLEWVAAGPVPASWFVFRNVLALWPLRAQMPKGAPASLAELYEGLCHELGVSPQKEASVHQEAAFQAAVVRGVQQAEEREAIARTLHKPLEASLIHRITLSLKKGLRKLRPGSNNENDALR
ncbi:hypothetical protein K2X33_14140 [bacterium]|nr:hypothetical protein [bacterium]